MENKIKKNSTTWILIGLITIAALLRFYNINWGAPYYFHPDERNIASSVSQLEFPRNMNPHFFAYGSLPIYTIFFTALPLSIFDRCQESFQNCSVRFENAIVIGRIYSAVFSLALIPLLFFVGKKMHSEQTGLLAAMIATFCTGFIQYAHFSTFEMWNTFFSVSLFFFCLMIINHPKKHLVVFLGLTVGALAAIKISNILLVPIGLLALSFGVYHRSTKKRHINHLLLLGGYVVLFTIMSILIYIITNPFVFLDFNSFKGAMEYESDVALGTLPVFYTGEFYSTIPLIYHFLKVFPFLLNPFLTILTPLAFLSILIQSYKMKNPALLLLLLTVLLLLVPQAFFFVKWVRYMVPTLPFIILTISVGVVMLHTFLQKKGSLFLAKFLFFSFFLSSSIFGLSFFLTSYVEPDTRVSASLFASQKITRETPIISEMYDMGIVPFNEHFSQIRLFNFYDLDNQSPEFTTQALKESLLTYEYIILPSQRGLATRLQNKQKFPEGFAFYNELTTNKDMFTLLYETPCSVFCKIAFLGDHIFRFEGTANGFDRPPLLIYKINYDAT